MTNEGLTDEMANDGYHVLTSYSYERFLLEKT